MEKKFDPKHAEKLKNPARLKHENPDFIWEKLGLDRPTCVVDAGCGLGFSAIPFAKKMPDGVVYACDISREMLDALSEEIKSMGINNVRPLLMEEVKIPLNDGCADALIMQNLHHELDAAVENLKECARVLRNGGRISIIDWKKKPSEFGPPLELRVSEKKIGSDLREAGFTQIVSLGGLPHHSFLTACKP